jgi:hypothetical protein
MFELYKLSILLLFLRDGARISGASDNMLATIYIRDQKSKQVIYILY